MKKKTSSWIIGICIAVGGLALAVIVLLCVYRLKNTTSLKEETIENNPAVPMAYVKDNVLFCIPDVERYMDGEGDEFPVEIAVSAEEGDATSDFGTFVFLDNGKYLCYSSYGCDGKVSLKQVETRRLTVDIDQNQSMVNTITSGIAANSGFEKVNNHGIVYVKNGHLYWNEGNVTRKWHESVSEIAIQDSMLIALRKKDQKKIYFDVNNCEYMGTKETKEAQDGDVSPDGKQVVIWKKNKNDSSIRNIVCYKKYGDELEKVGKLGTTDYLYSYGGWLGDSYYYVTADEGTADLMEYKEGKLRAIEEQFMKSEDSGSTVTVGKEGAITYWVSCYGRNYDDGELVINSSNGKSRVLKGKFNFDQQIALGVADTISFCDIAGMENIEDIKDIKDEEDDLYADEEADEVEK